MGRENFPTDQTLRFGYAVELRRTMLRMKRRDLAERAELSYPYISEIEKGMKEPSAKSLRQLADALEFESVTELMSFVEQQQLPADTFSDKASSSAPLVYPGHTDQWTFAALQSSLPQSLPPRASGTGNFDDALERMAGRLVDQVVASLRQELPRLVESEVSRQLGERRGPR